MTDDEFYWGQFININVGYVRIVQVTNLPWEILHQREFRESSRWRATFHVGCRQAAVTHTRQQLGESVARDPKLNITVFSLNQHPTTTKSSTQFTHTTVLVNIRNRHSESKNQLFSIRKSLLTDRVCGQTFSRLSRRHRCEVSAGAGSGALGAARPRSGREECAACGPGPARWHCGPLRSDLCSFAHTKYN